MKGPGIKEYENEIQAMKEKAIKKGKKYIDISAKELHKTMSPNHATMPTCCQAIYKWVLVGDEMLGLPKGSTGFGSRLHVRCYLHELTTRERLFPVKRRGRPCLPAIQVKRIKEKKEKLRKIDDSQLQTLLCDWLTAQGLTYKVAPGYLEVNTDKGPWVIYIYGVRRGRKQPISSLLLKTLQVVTNDNARYSIAINDESDMRRSWKEIPTAIKTRLEMSLILVDKQRNIKEV